MSSAGSEYRQESPLLSNPKDGLQQARELVKKIRKQFRNNQKEQHSERSTLGKQILEANKDVSKFTRNVLWRGGYSDFMENSKSIPRSIIESRLEKNQKYAFRAVGPTEFVQIINSEGIGGPNYRGTVVSDGTLFASDLVPPLAMMDGRTYGGDDDRSSGGYIVVVNKDGVFTDEDDLAGTSVVSVNRKIPLADVHAVFGIRISREYINEIEPQYEIYQVVLDAVE